MPIDRYTRAILTIIALALVYLCVVLTPIPALHAQQSARRPGDPTGPGEVVIVGWRLPQGGSLPVQIAGTAAVQVLGDVRVTGQVTTEQRENTADRVTIVGWQERATERSSGSFRAFEMENTQRPRGLPVSETPIIK